MNFELIKVCGMREADNIRKVEQLFTSSPFHLFTLWMGFIFWPKSSRYVSERPAYLPTKCKRVGVFVDADIADVQQKVEEYDLDIIQLHGSETPEQISHLSSLTRHPSIIKAFNIATAEDLEQTKAYEGLVDYFLFDTKGKSVGGNGEKFDWDVLAHYQGHTPFLLSGGIGPDDADRIKDFLTPYLLPPTSYLQPPTSSFQPPTSQCLGIDLNSRFELEPGMKDVAALRRFLSQLFQNTH